MAQALEARVEVRDRKKAQGALAELAAGDDFGGEQRIMGLALKKVQPLAGHDLATRADERLPCFLRAGQAAGEQDFDASLEKLPGSGIGGAERLRLLSAAAAKEAGRQHLGVVEDQQVGGTEQAGKVTKVQIFNRLI